MFILWAASVYILVANQDQIEGIGIIVNSKLTKQPIKTTLNNLLTIP